MTMTVTKGGVPESKALQRPVHVKIWRTCGLPGSDRFAPTFERGKVYELPLGRARELVRYHQAGYTDEPADQDLATFRELEEAASKARKADAAPPKPKKAPPKK